MSSYAGPFKYIHRLTSLNYCKPSKNLITNMQNCLVHHVISTKLCCALPQCTGSCRSLSPKSMDRIVRIGRMKEEEPHVKYKTRMSDCSLASDCLYTVAINQTIISVSNKKTSSCDGDLYHRSMVSHMQPFLRFHRLPDDI